MNGRVLETLTKLARAADAAHEAFAALARAAVELRDSDSGLVEPECYDTGVHEFASWRAGDHNPVYYTVWHNLDRDFADLCASVRVGSDDDGWRVMAIKERGIPGIFEMFRVGDNPTVTMQPHHGAPRHAMQVMIDLRVARKFGKTPSYLRVLVGDRVVNQV